MGQQSWIENTQSLCNGGGCVLADQVKSLNWQVCRAKLKAKAPKKVMQEVLGKLGVLIFGDEK